MDGKDNTPVVDSDGTRGFIIAQTGSEDERSRVLVELDGGLRALIPADSLQLQEDGSYYLPGRLPDYELSSGAKRQLAAGEKIILPIVEEELDIQKRMQEIAKVRLSKIVREREELVDIPLLKEEVEVTRVPVNREVAGPVAVRYEGDTLIVPFLEEVLVVEKRLVLREELHISKVRTKSSHRERVKLRKEDAVVERTRSRKKKGESESLGRRDAAGSQS